MSQTDQRIVYGARCAWWDGIEKVSTAGAGPLGGGIPCCPHCGGMLFEMQSPAEWWAGVETFQNEPPGHAGYRDFTEWRKGKCFPDLKAALAAYEAKGRKVENMEKWR